jgi:hypothetical protein
MEAADDHSFAVFSRAVHNKDDGDGDVDGELMRELSLIGHAMCSSSTGGGMSLSGILAP